MGEVKSTSRGNESDILGQLMDLHHFTALCIAPNETVEGCRSADADATAVIGISWLLLAINVLFAGDMVRRVLYSEGSKIQQQSTGQ